MTVTGVSSADEYVTADFQTRAKASSSTTVPGVSTDTISLSTDAITFAETGESDNFKASNYLSLFSVLNANILDYSNLAGVGSAIDTYKNSLAGSNVYRSSYTAPSAKYLGDLSDLKAAAASGDLGKSQSLLAKAKLDAPDSVAGGISTAISKGDTAGEAGLVVEGTANMSDFLAAHGYEAAGAATEAAAITINGFSLGTRNALTSSSSAQTRFQQISNLAVYAAKNQETNQPSTSATTNEVLFNIISTLIEAKSGTAIDESLTELASLYGVSTSSATSIHA